MSIGFEETLDPQDWERSRALAHKMVDDAIEYLASVRERGVWNEIPETVRAYFDAPIASASLGRVHNTSFPFFFLGCFMSRTQILLFFS